jgi:hypothetical protein
MVSPRGGAAVSSTSRVRPNHVALLDLISPWATAVDAPDAPLACERFRARHSSLLDALCRQRAPDTTSYPLPGEATALRACAAWASDPDLQQRLREQVQAAAELGALTPASVMLFAGGDDGDSVEVLPGQKPTVTLFLDRCVDMVDLSVALSRGLASITRWCATDSRSVMRAAPMKPWDRWQLARTVPLGEWIYTEGVGVHLAHALAPDVPHHKLLGCSRGALRRTREREHAIRPLLVASLNQTGLGLVLRWLAPQAPASVRTDGSTVLPPGAGRYLGWRMTAERVARVGIGEALRMSL